jgi:hypothetical protein
MCAAADAVPGELVARARGRRRGRLELRRVVEQPRIASASPSTSPAGTTRPAP